MLVRLFCRCAVCNKAFDEDDEIDWDHLVDRSVTANKMYPGAGQGEKREKESAKHKVSYLCSRPAPTTAKAMVCQASREILGLTGWGGCQPVHRFGCHARGR